MTDQRSVIDRTLDLVLFAPLGLAVTIVEELPEFAGKGRARLSQRASTARLVGQFAVAEGRRRLRSMPASPASGLSAASSQSQRAGASAADGEGGAARTGPSGLYAAPPAPETARPGRSSSRPGRPARPSGWPSTPGAREPEGRASRPGAPTDGTAPLGGGDMANRPASGELAIPGYDSLSASQVVQRLASLSAAELEAVRGYEAATRGRRTILARVAQLQRG